MRKEINLDTKVIHKLQKLADADKRSLKSFMEKILIEKSETAAAVRQKSSKNIEHNAKVFEKVICTPSKNKNKCKLLSSKTMF